MTAEQIALKPCPFCGGEASFYLTPDIQIICERGHVFAGHFGYLGSREHLIAAWNTRAQETPDA